MLAFISLLTHSGGRFWSRANLLTRGRKFRRQTIIFSCSQKLKKKKKKGEGENTRKGRAEYMPITSRKNTDCFAG